eukprot:gene32340-5386_t
MMEALLGIGFGFVEVGSITAKPQPGNAKPRIFRIPEYKAMVNRYGNNSLGSDAAQDNLDDFMCKAEMHPDVKPGPVGVNLGMNKRSKDLSNDYGVLVSKLAPYADYLVINVPSPTAPGQRALQSRKILEEMIKQVKSARDKLHWGPGGPPPLLIKIAPDMSDLDLADITTVVAKHHIDGLIVSNTTMTRPGDVTQSPISAEAGGLSGPPLFELSTKVLHNVYRLTGGRVPIIGCGGVSTGEDAYKKIRAGASLVQLYTALVYDGPIIVPRASLVQLYTALVYDGPIIVPRIKAELAACLKRDGFKCIADAVGADHREAAPKKRGWLWGWPGVLVWPGPGAKRPGPAGGKGTSTDRGSGARRSGLASGKETWTNRGPGARRQGDMD